MEKFNYAPQETITLKPKQSLKVSQALPYLEKIASRDGLRLLFSRDMDLAYRKFLLLLLICEQNNLQYFVNRDFRIADEIYQKSLTQN